MHPNLVAVWKKQALKQLPSIFAGAGAAWPDSYPEKDALYQEIGKLKVELGFLKKWPGTVEDRHRWGDPEHPQLSIGRQCELLGLARSSYYYSPKPESAENLVLLRRLDELHLEHSFLGSRRLAELSEVNCKRVVQPMRIAGIEALHPKPRLSQPGPGQEIHPYLLRDLVIEEPNQVWSSDITYVPMRRGFLYLVAVMDWFSRDVLSWALSATLEASFCREALGAALRLGPQEIFNSDQRAQFTAPEFTAKLRQHQIQISMDGRGRWLDNVFIERLWRSVKDELIDPGDFADGRQLWTALDGYSRFYNHSRPYPALAYRTRAEVFGLSAALMAQVRGWGSAPIPGIYGSRPDWLFYRWRNSRAAVHWKGLTGRQGDAGMRFGRLVRSGLKGRPYRPLLCRRRTFQDWD